MRILRPLAIREMATVLAMAALSVIIMACNSSAPTNTEGPPVQTAAQNSATAGLSEQDASTSASSETVQRKNMAVTVSTADAQRNDAPVSPASPVATQTPNGALQPQSGADHQQVVLAFENVLHEIYQSVLPSVVYIRVPNPSGEMLREIPGIPENLLWGEGSGFVWDTEGHIVTNYHVVEGAIGESDEVVVIFADGTRAKGVVIGSDPHSDLAVVKLEDGDWNLQAAPLGDSSEVRVGQLAVAIGAPFGQEFTMTSGIVSAIGRNIRGERQFTIPEVIQTDAAVNPGNSGGPLLDRLGRVIGINTLIISPTGSYSGVGMAVPVNIAKRVAPSLIADGEFNYPWLGVSIGTVNGAYAEALGLPGDSSGALVITVVADGPADESGLRGSDDTVEVGGLFLHAGGDVIVEIGSHEVKSSNDLIAHLTYSNSPGDTVVFTVLRDGERKEIEVALGERP